MGKKKDSDLEKLFKPHHYLVREYPIERTTETVKDPFKDKSDEERIDGLIKDRMRKKLVKIFGQQRFEGIAKKIVELKAIEIELLDPKGDSMNVFPYRVAMYTSEQHLTICGPDVYVSPNYTMGEIVDLETLLEYNKNFNPYKGMANVWGIDYFIKRDDFYGFLPNNSYSKYRCVWRGNMSIDEIKNDPRMIWYKPYNK